MIGRAWQYLHLQRELSAGVVGLVVAREVVAVAVRVDDVGLHQAVLRPQGRKVLAAREAAVSERRHAEAHVPVLRLGRQQERRRGGGGVRRRVVLRPVRGQVEQRVLEGQRHVHGGRLLLLLLGQRVRRQAARVTQTQTARHARAARPCRHAASGPEGGAAHRTEPGQPGQRALRGVQHVVDGVQVRHAVDA